jgi:ABC-type protease/lipase transport system fused ATPase/permease subunit
VASRSCAGSRSASSPVSSSRWSGRPAPASRHRPAAAAAVRRGRRRGRLGGVDVRELSARTIRETLGLVTQDGHLFHESVRSNLLLARPGVGDDELWEVLRRARLADLVASLPDGLDTVVGERGYRLSAASGSA